MLLAVYTLIHSLTHTSVCVCECACVCLRVCVCVYNLCVGVYGGITQTHTHRQREEFDLGFDKLESEDVLSLECVLFYRSLTWTPLMRSVCSSPTPNTTR